MTKHINSISVFCGSRPGTLPVFAEEAEALGRLMAEQDLQLVYGSGGAGLMGAVSRAYAQRRAELEVGPQARAALPPIGVNLHMFEEIQSGTPASVQEATAETMSERKAFMLGISDAYIVLPGGVGTIDEIGEALVENDVMRHHNKKGFIKAVILVNTEIDGEGFWDDQLRQLEKCLRFGFTNAAIGRYYAPVPTAHAAIEMIEKLNRQGPVLTTSDYPRLLLPGHDGVAPANQNVQINPQLVHA